MLPTPQAEPDKNATVLVPFGIGYVMNRIFYHILAKRQEKSSICPRQFAMVFRHAETPDR